MNLSFKFDLNMN